MLVITAFDDKTYPPRPLITSIREDGKVETYYLYLPGTKKTLYTVSRDIRTITNRIELSKEPVFLNDAKSHTQVFNIKRAELYQINPRIPPILSKGQYEKLFDAIMPTLQATPEGWRSLLAKVSGAYIALETRPVFLDEIRVYPRYHLDTFTGRSRCTNFNIQGASADMPVKTKDSEDFFICCDWISADIRVAAAISGDEELNESFIESDPYTVMSEGLDLPRKECKIAFLKSIYSLDIDSPILELFQTLRKWMIAQIGEMRSKRILRTPLGRQFKLDSRDEKSVFNAVLQGTVAHAMQSSLSRLEHAREHLLTETYDSIIFSCRRGLIPHIIKAAVDVMLEPLKGFPTFPLRVYIGKEWKKWKLYKEFR